MPGPDLAQGPPVILRPSSPGTVAFLPGWDEDDVRKVEAIVRTPPRRPFTRSDADRLERRHPGMTVTAVIALGPGRWAAVILAISHPID